MKKIVLSIFVFTIFSFTAYAETPPQQNITAIYSPNITVYYDGYLQDFRTSGGMEISPIVYKNATYLPLRSVGNMLHKGVSWDPDNYCVTLDDTNGVLTNYCCSYLTNNSLGFTPQSINVKICPNIKIYINGELKNLINDNGDAIYPIIYRDTTYLPVRGISQIFEEQITWDNANKNICIGKTATEIIEKPKYRKVELGEKCLQIIADADTLHETLESYARMITDATSSLETQRVAWNSYCETFREYNDIGKRLRYFNQSGYTQSEMSAY